MTQHTRSFDVDRQVSLPVPAWNTTFGTTAGQLSIKALAPSPEVVPPPAVEAAPAKAAQNPMTPPPQKGKALKRLLLAGLVLAALGAGGAFGWDYWSVGRFHVSTDDAYVQADSTTIAPKISGYLSEVLVGDNQTVSMGQVMARIDDRDYRVALD